MEQHKTAHVLCYPGNETGPKIEIFPAEQWDRPGAREGFYRIRIDRLWHCADVKFTFLSPEQIGELLVSQLGLVEPVPDQKPDIRLKQRVSVLGQSGWTMGIIGSTPIQGSDGRWRVWVTGYGFKDFFLCEEIRR